VCSESTTSQRSKRAWLCSEAYKKYFHAASLQRNNTSVTLVQQNRSTVQHNAAEQHLQLIQWFICTSPKKFDSCTRPRMNGTKKERKWDQKSARSRLEKKVIRNAYKSNTNWICSFMRIALLSKGALQVLTLNLYMRRCGLINVETFCYNSAVANEALAQNLLIKP
jgi:hypothetical protein